jgi:hypothetical protein
MHLKTEQTPQSIQFDPNKKGEALKLLPFHRDHRGIDYSIPEVVGRLSSQS